jgi:hypothetical protein
MTVLGKLKSLGQAVRIDPQCPYLVAKPNEANILTDERMLGSINRNLWEI